ncbi:Lrp/AsnC family transcriptional regulator [Rhodococcus rhodnii]|uniref:AsnC family transcriptional regulator n=2 Tax=Rhodococcus rhodnii TaxID=38312 RepID=R7WNK5_9NOCA|nr:Lrp/AsnC family transcriptional regulator [Rhodococcus rhodnii]EOM76850.1 AsnC family transcriptional regulator [Rhodococcus rhodnii LMG 5362]TXG89783.1 Lrp/AsnC family transcriptional regulator [Rhodococcus rhodnii]
MPDAVTLDDLDFALLDALHSDPRAGALELSRRLRVARGTVQAHLRKLEEGGVIASHAPHIGLDAAGFGVQAFVTLETSQGALDAVTRELTAIPGILEAFTTTGSGDVLCRVAARSHLDLQETLIRVSTCAHVARSTSVMVLSVIVPFRTLPLLHTLERPQTSKAPAYRPEAVQGVQQVSPPPSRR